MRTFADWGQSSTAFDILKESLSGVSLATANEAQTRYTVIDHMVRGVLGWPDNMVSVEERDAGDDLGFLDYVMRCGD